VDMLYNNVMNTQDIYARTYNIVKVLLPNKMENMLSFAISNVILSCFLSFSKKKQAKCENLGFFMELIMKKFRIQAGSSLLDGSYCIPRTKWLVPL